MLNADVCQLAMADGVIGPSKAAGKSLGKGMRRGFCFNKGESPWMLPPGRHTFCQKYAAKPCAPAQAFAIREGGNKGVGGTQARRENMKKPP